MSDTTPDTAARSGASGDDGFMSFDELVEFTAAQARHSTVEEPEWLRAGMARTGGDAYVHLARALRETRDAIAEAHLDEAACAQLARHLEGITAYARSIPATAGAQVWSNRFDLPGRGSPFPPDMWEVRVDPVHGRVECRVRFGTSYVGFGGAAHGGAIALHFDEVLGMCANSGRAISRTAYLHVDYRSLAPLNEDLVTTGRIDRLEGRKRFVTAEIRRMPEPGSDEPGVVVAEAEGLFVELRPGQG